jgi:3-deoxy-D-manno-octulosonic-acid transferase
MRVFVEQLTILILSIFLTVLFALGRCLRVLFRSSRFVQFEGRGPKDSSSAWSIPADATANDILFFCSSAGEYEQALPIAQRLNTSSLTCNTPLSAIFLFLSRSGLDFFRARSESGRAGLAPVDTLWNWEAFRRRHHIEASVVVRHEWWPAFLQVMGKTGPLILVDATLPAADPGSAWKNAARGYLARKFSLVFTVDAASRSFFIDSYGVSPEKITVAGDTKFDRALDRAKLIAPAKLSTTIRDIAGGRNILVGGSVYDPDAKMLIQAFSVEPSLRDNWLMVLVPHHVGCGAGERFVNLAKSCGLSVLEINPSSNEAIPGKRFDVLTVDMMGSLAELYSFASAAWIGGACHSKVHNVLEPAVHGAWLACGMRFRNSREAIMMNDAGLLYATQSVSQIIAWLQDAGAGEKSPNGTKNMRTRVFIEQHAGAAIKIAGQIAQSIKRQSAEQAPPTTTPGVSRENMQEKRTGEPHA